jgi:thiamine-phosphate pyrophosphorylase
MRIPDFRLYLITDRKYFSATCYMYMALEIILEAGVKAVQLREKDLAQKELLDMAVWMRELTSQHGALLFINDRIDVALSVQADGVHLGNESLPVSAARKVSRGRLLVGVSAHSTEQALEAEHEGADYVTVGPLYETTSKLGYGSPLGIDTLRAVRRNIRIPLYGIGGIRLHNARQVREAGADGVALISGILGAGRLKETTEEFLRLVQ